jgi:hypothetical protein
VTIEKPPWNCTDERWWLTWANEQFDALDAQAEVTADERALYASFRFLTALSPTDKREADRKLGIPVAKARWHYDGEGAPLGKLFPEVAETFVPPPRWRQRHRRRDLAIKRHLLKLAIEDVYRIRALLRSHFDGRWKRGRDTPPTVVRLAALRNGIDEDKLEDAILKSRSRDMNHPK